MILPMKIHTLAVLFLALQYLSGTQTGAAGQPPVKNQADRDWGEAITPPVGKNKQPDWDWAINKTREFQRRHPGDSRTGAARKLELMARLHKDRGNTEINREVDEYINNSKNSSKERYELKSLALTLRENPDRLKKHQDVIRTRSRHARELIKAFPDDPRGYGTLLALAKSDPTDAAVGAARQILESPAPENLKQGAKTLLEQRDMIGRKLNVEGLDISHYKGRCVVIYTWEHQRPGILKYIRQFSKMPDTVFIGVNLDADITAARKIGGKLATGLQIYEGKGRSGAIASQLKLTTNAAIYIVNAVGILVDAHGGENTIEKIKANGLQDTQAP
jgi:hypothetical protein